MCVWIITQLNPNEYLSQFPRYHVTIADDDEPERPESLEEAVATIGRLNKFSKAAMKRVFELEKKVFI